MAALHKFNPVRLAYIRDQAAACFDRDPKKLDCLKGLRILDIGCGGGILSEPLARLGAEMVGADPSEENITAARAHAEDAGVTVDYRATTAEELAAANERFDVVLAMEVVEHVTDVNAFVATCATMVKPGGLMIAATLNRTLKSFALAIVGAEYVLRWLPRGTHQWDKFVTPVELEIRDRTQRPCSHRRARRDLQSVCRPLAAIIRYGRQLHAGRATPEDKRRGRMILELVEFNSPKGWTRQQVAEEARNVIPKWRANKELLRKHFLLELNGKTGAGVYIWPSVEAAKSAHNEEWRQSVIKRTGGAPTIRYFDLFLLIDNEKGAVTEFPEAAEIRHCRVAEMPARHGRACPGHPRLVRKRRRGCPAQGRA